MEVSDFLPRKLVRQSIRSFDSPP